MESQFDNDYRRFIFKTSLLIGASISGVILIYYAFIFGPHQAAVYIRLFTVSVFLLIYAFFTKLSNYRIGVLLTLIYSIVALTLHLNSFKQPDLAPTYIHIPLIIFAATFFGGLWAGIIACLTLSLVVLWIFFELFPFQYQPVHPYFPQFFVEILISAFFTLIIAYFFEKVRQTYLEKIRNQAMMLANSAKLSSLGMIAGGIAHEVSNPLSIVLGQLEIMKKDEGISQNEAAMKRLDKAFAGCQRISRIVDGIRTLYVTNENSQQNETNPQKLLLELLDNFQMEFAGTGIELKQNLIPELRIKIDSTHLELIFKNIIKNSVDALRDSTREKYLTMSCEISTEKLRLYFDDTGTGIDEAHLTKVFDPFFTTKVCGRGMGLGLTLVHNIIQTYGWQIEAKRHNNRTRIIISIPSTHFRLQTAHSQQKKLSIPTLTSPQSAY
ncbi:MAG: ATP-binding protein [Oligoflexus sp.]